MADKFSERSNFLDLQEGQFVAERPLHAHYLEHEHSQIISHLLKVMQPAELSQIRLNQETRRILLHSMEKFYALHIQDFGTMKTLPVLEAVLS
jgi:DNA repair protein RecO (recombination protein O)